MATVSININNTIYFNIEITKPVCSSIMLLTCIQKVRGSGLGQGTNYPD
jgi:hypothetical protein